MNKFGVNLLAYYVTSIFVSFITVIAGVYAFVTVYGWWTFAAVIAIGIVLQIWWRVTVRLGAPDANLNSAVLRAKQAEAEKAVRESGEAVDKFVNRRR